MIKKLLKRIKQDLEQQTKDNFRRESFGRNKWSPRKHHYPHKILNKTGKLKRGFRYTIRGNTLQVRNRTSYGGYHQSGTDKLPARKMVGWNKQLEAKITKSVSKVVLEMLKK